MNKKTFLRRASLEKTSGLFQMTGVSSTSSTSRLSSRPANVVCLTFKNLLFLRSSFSSLFRLANVKSSIHVIGLSRKSSVFKQLKSRNQSFSMRQSLFFDKFRYVSLSRPKNLSKSIFLRSNFDIIRFSRFSRLSFINEHYKINPF